jgi:hypothetical protein
MPALKQAILKGGRWRQYILIVKIFPKREINFPLDKGKIVD